MGREEPLPFGERTDDEAALPISPLTAEEIAAAALPKTKKKLRKKVPQTKETTNEGKSIVPGQLLPVAGQSQPTEAPEPKHKRPHGLLAVVKKTLTGGN